jgi:prepilin-type N-terminal cleavage/methylation domain-containing protein
MRRRNEDGLTLPELLIAMVITSIIMVPLAGAVFTTLHTAAPTQSRIDESNGADLLASYFEPDIQNSVTVSANYPALVNEPTATCGPSAHAVALLLTTSADGTTTVSYYRGTGATDGNVLYRRTCAVVGGAGTASQPVRVMRSLSPSVAPQFTVQTDPISGAWLSVTGTVTQSDSRFSGSTYATVVEGNRRVS